MTAEIVDFMKYREMKNRLDNSSSSDGTEAMEIQREPESEPVVQPVLARLEELRKKDSEPG
ncbi:MAG: hypothetical protein ISR51_03815 [Rhodospirillales bacterium]|nr:hypothetical protein [Alphaproteobacteria bacterium]MBL6947780.1 hypothetical protein [Rhodospirillales bacterium]